MDQDESFELPIAQKWVEQDKVRVGQNVRDLRAAAGLSQVALADAMRNAGMDHWRQTTVSRIENGAQTITNTGELKALEAILGDGVMRGTDFEDMMRKAGRRIHDAFVRVKLGMADKALTESIEQSQAALKQVRHLRYVFDDEFAARHPEVADVGFNQEAP
jgi:ribosome-binding protein aMBF1 (putative translation factor)